MTNLIWSKRLECLTGSDKAPTLDNLLDTPQCEIQFSQFNLCEWGVSAILHSAISHFQQCVNGRREREGETERERDGV